MLDKPIAYFQSLTLLQKLSLLGAAGAVATVAGSSVAYQVLPQFADMVDRHRNVAIIATAALLAPVLGVANVPVVGDLVPQQLKLPPYGALYMGAIGMKPNPIALGAADSGARAAQGELLGEQSVEPEPARGARAHRAGALAAF